jgi:tryptophanyl-tRNA synthetase
MSVVVSGIKPTGTPHLGNYLGMIRPALQLAAENEAYYFVADHHALNTNPDPDLLRARVREVAATLLALGLDPERTVLYRQSDVPAVCELAQILGSVTPKGLLNRAHAYKAATSENIDHGRDCDAGVNLGLFTYPLLMAADILYPGANVVPVGLDQRQHLEITRDIAEAFNSRYGELLTIPEPVVDEAAKTVVGTDGRKMSKSYGNVIPILADADTLRRAVMGIVTNSQRPEEPKNPEEDTIFTLFRLVAAPERTADMRRRYEQGGLRYADAKGELFAVLDERFRDPRRRFAELMGDRHGVERVLADGARRVHERGHPLLEAVRAAVGLTDLRRPRR